MSSKDEYKKVREKQRFQKEKRVNENKIKRKKHKENINIDSEKSELKKKKQIKRKKIIYILLIIFLLLFNALTVSYLVYVHFLKSEEPIRSELTVDAKDLRLDVVDLNSKTRPFAVMIDNNENAWPQFNINEAMVVYEMHVEAGLTRLMAIFKDKPKLTKIGPLRSARHYFLDYVKEYDAIYVHEGYSPRAIKEIYSRNIDTIVYTSGLFYRDNTRWAPHNAITSGKRMTDAAKKRGYSLTTKKKPPLKYSRLPVKLENPISATTINTAFSSYATLKLVYNEKTKKYEKHEIGEALKDAVTKKPMAATNIIILHANSHLLTGYGAGKGRVDIDTTQNMSGYYFTHGEGVKIKAKKKTRDSQTVYSLENGNELRVNDGNTFIFLVPKSQKINIKGKKKTETTDKNQNIEQVKEDKGYITLEEILKDERIKVTKIDYNPQEFTIFDYIKQIFSFLKKDKTKEEKTEENQDEKENKKNDEVKETKDDKKEEKKEDNK